MTGNDELYSFIMMSWREKEGEREREGEREKRKRERGQKQDKEGVYDIIIAFLSCLCI